MLNWIQAARVLSVGLVLAAAQGTAAEVKVEGVHLCCGGCVKSAAGALSNVEGVSNAKVDQDTETVTFDAKDDESAVRGLAALAGAGLYGKTETKGPDFKVDKKATKDVIKLTKVHNCCGGCQKSIIAALEAVPNVKGVQQDASNKQTFTVKGTGINLAETLKALHKAGFHATIE